MIYLLSYLIYFSKSKWKYHNNKKNYNRIKEMKKNNLTFHLSQNKILNLNYMIYKQNN